jgi:hypothetical protein
MGLETECPSPYFLEVKNAWNCNPTLPYVFMTSSSIKHRNNFSSQKKRDMKGSMRKLEDE